MTNYPFAGQLYLEGNIRRICNGIRLFCNRLLSRQALMLHFESSARALLARGEDPASAELRLLIAWVTPATRGL